MYTIKDIAERAGVAIGTVSRVLRHHPAVQDDIRKRVLKVVEEVGYKPLRNRSGHKQVKHVGIVTLGMDQSLATLPVIGLLLSGVHNALSNHNITLSIIDIPDPEKLPAIISSRGVDAVIIKAVLRSGSIQWPASINSFLSDIPHVWLTGCPPGFSGDVCGIDDYSIGLMAANNLFKNGHQRIAVINPDPGHLIFSRRCVAFMQAAHNNNAVVDVFESHTPSPSFPCPPVANLQDILPLVDKVLAQRQRPTAIFVPADSIAVQVYRALAIRGINIGDDISILSVNNEKSLIAGLYPMLSTFDIHAEEIGCRSVELLLWRIDNNDAVENILLLSPTLIKGESVKNINGG
jgi:DNA-binding LacI/PurR family transcriptional regulator